MKRFFCVTFLILIAQTANAESLVNVRTNAVFLLAKAFDLSGEFNIGKGFALGPTLIGYQTESANETPPAKNNGGGLGVRISYNLNGEAHTEGWMFSMALIAGENKISKGDYSGTARGSIMTVLGGYLWVFESGFNMALSGGFISSAVANSVELKNSAGATTTQALPGPATNFMPEFSLGWIF